MSRRRIWSETVPYERLAQAETLALLERYQLELLVAVGPGQQRQLHRLLATLHGAGVKVGLWPQLADGQGRWVNVSNVETYCEQVRRLVAGLSDRGVQPTEIAVNLEPPLPMVAQWLTATGPSSRQLGKAAAGWLKSQWAPRASSGRRPAPMSRAVSCLSDLVAELRDAGIGTSSTSLPFVLLDDATADAAASAPRPGGWQALLGTPVDGVAWDHANVMIYASLLEGWSRGLLDRRDALSILRAACRTARARFGPAAGVSLGLVGTGAFGHEPVYRSAQELAEEVAVAERAGVDDLTLFDLGGVLGRPPAQKWLEAFTRGSTTIASPEPTATFSRRQRWKTAAAWALARTVGATARRLYRE